MNKLKMKRYLRYWVVGTWRMFVVVSVPFLFIIKIGIEWKLGNALDTIVFLFLYLICLLWGFGHHRAERWAKVQVEEEK